MTRQELIKYYKTKLACNKKELDAYANAYKPDKSDYFISRLCRKSYFVGAIASLELMEGTK